ncbi:hypothetical protein RS030_152280 [Cryptosporidium xiaoi]|uniref:Dolichyl-diphosphooligosaccharide-protein glycosyltransferase subunit OST5 n=1 Tax=Cryptosporidium xiaoi TaxID=659607 RepID=A0AAV9Y140_9CRYT
MDKRFNPGPFPLLVSTESFGSTSLILIALSLFFIAFFIVYEFRFPKNKKRFVDELLISIAGSLSLGMGITFLLLSFGLYF